MGKSYETRLKVCDTNGKVIIAKVEQINRDVSKITLPFIKAVSQDEKLGFKNGIIAKQYPRKDHLEVIKKLTSYLESLFLGELENEDNNSSKHVGDISGRDKGSTDTRPTIKSEGDEPSSLHGSRRRRKPSGSSGTGSTKSDVATGGNSES